MKVEIITIISSNYGNRLQNYALQEYLKKLGIEVCTSRAVPQNLLVLRKIRNILVKFRRKSDGELFAYFDTKIQWKKTNGFSNNDDETIDYYIAGSDQIWNPMFKFNTDREFLTFTKKEKRIAYAASIGIDTLPEEIKERYKNNISAFSHVSVREDAASKIIEELTGMKVPVVIDPTMLLTVEEWEKVSRYSIHKTKQPYIVKYFLGTHNPEYDAFISNYAKKHSYKVIDITNHQDRGITGIGPAEFIYLFMNCKAAFVDSFHGTVFSILFHKPFLSFSRPSEEGNGDMNSRFDTLLNMFDLKNRYIISPENCVEIDTSIDYSRVDKILQQKRSEADIFLKSALSIK